jgi:drug/metabolite transporter (DMT)-like permease
MVKNKKNTSKSLIGIFSLLLVGILFGISGVIAKYLTAPLNPYQVVEYRFGIAFIGSVFLLLLLKRKLNFKQFNKTSLLLFAVTFPISVILFTFSIFHASVALAVFSFYSATLISQFVLGRLFFSEKINTYKKLAFVAMIIALVAFTNPFSHFTISIGLIYGLLSGIVQGIASSFQKSLSNSKDKNSLLVIQTFTGFILAALILVASNKPLFVNLTGFEWFTAIIFGLSMLAITYLFLIGYKYVNLNTGSILVSSELFFGPFFAFILLSENISTIILIGGLFTITAALLANAPYRKQV